MSTHLADTWTIHYHSLFITLQILMCVCEVMVYLGSNAYSMSLRGVCVYVHLPAVVAPEDVVGAGIIFLLILFLYLSFLKSFSKLH